MPHDTQALDFFRTRRSYPAKMMRGTSPTEAELRDILTAAVRVPDHGKLEPWRLLVLNAKALSRIASAVEAAGPKMGIAPEKVAKPVETYSNANCAVAVIFSPKHNASIPVIEQQHSAAALCANVTYAATAAGWGASWVSGWFSHDAEFVQTHFGLSENETIVGIVHIGERQTEPPERPRPDLNAVTHWVTE